MPRPPTDVEKANLKKLFPKMDVNRVAVTDEATKAYNCLAWTLGITNAWVWPWGDRPATKSEFDALYRSHGFIAAASGEIAAFGAGPTLMKHGAISGAGHGPRWESKLGEEIRIQHGLAEMEGGYYADVKGFYTKALTGPQLDGDRRLPQPMKLEQTELNEIAKHASSVPAKVRKSFESAYKAWRATWEHPWIKYSSNPTDRRQSTQFLDLIAMGPQILPLLIERLTHSDDFFALQAFDQLVPSHQVITFEVEDSRLLLGEQERAALTVQRWLAVNS